MINGFEIRCDIENAERLFLDLAAGNVTRSQLIA